MEFTPPSKDDQARSLQRPSPALTTTRANSHRRRSRSLADRSSWSRLEHPSSSWTREARILWCWSWALLRPTVRASTSRTCRPRNRAHAERPPAGRPLGDRPAGM